MSPTRPTQALLEGGVESGHLPLPVAEVTDSAWMKP